MMKTATWRELILAVGLIIGVWCPSVMAQVEAPPATFAERLAQLRTPLQVGAHGFGGSGAAILMEAVKSSRYVLIGEDHLTREIPRFTANLCRVMAPEGLVRWRSRWAPKHPT